MRSKQLMNRDWRFYFGEPTYLRTRAESSDQTYRGTRAANARGPARRDFNDSGWKIVQLPHDFVALNGISETDPHGGEHFDFPMDRGSAWYRRYFYLAEEDKDQRIVLHFEGMGTFCEIYVNSMLLKTHRTNGIGFDVDITDVARFGYEQNEVSVHCDCHDFEAWYYEGGGITRNVWLVKTDKISVDLWGTFVTSKQLDAHKWELTIETEVRNDHNEEREVKVCSCVAPEAAEENILEAEPVAILIPGRSIRTARQQLIVTDPLLWSPKHTDLYQLKTALYSNDTLTDTYDTTFGIREFRFDKDHGLFINGEKTVVYGFANHMLYLGVGEAMTNSMCEFQMRTLRDMGSNGYRTAHSPHPDDIMNWCDRYGQLVMDENRIFHSSEIVIDEVQRLIKRDRNHPSVCMWSVYNEEDFVTMETGRRIFRTLKEEIRKLDPTRPVTGATSYGMFSEDVHEDYDLFGFNHQTMNFDALHHMKPDLPIYCSEMIMPLGRKRDFPGLTVRPGEDALQLHKDYMIGGFHFTAWGYGAEEPEIIGMDGTLGTGYYGFKAYLRPDEPLAKICPGWDFPGKEGQEVTLNLANNGDCVEIILNGKPVGNVDTDPYSITPYTLTYEPGEFKIVAYKEGKPWAEDTVRTPGQPARIELVLENGELAADGTDAAIVSAYITDAEGNHCQNETGTLITFSCNEMGELITTLSLRDDQFQGHVGEKIRVYKGKAQALYRSLAGSDDLVVCAKAEGLEPASLRISRSKPAYAQVPDCASNMITNWHISKLYPGQMDDKAIIKAHMLERWLPVDTVGSPVIPTVSDPEISRNYAYHAQVTIPDMGEKGDQILALRFEGIDGKANIYITDGTKTACGHHKGDSPWFGHYRPELIVPCDQFKPGQTVEVWVMMHDIGRVHGIGWPVHWLYTTQEAIDQLDQKTDREWEYYKFRYPEV